MKSRKQTSRNHHARLGRSSVALTLLACVVVGSITVLALGDGFASSPSTAPWEDGATWGLDTVCYPDQNKCWPNDDSLPQLDWWVTIDNGGLPHLNSNPVLAGLTISTGGVQGFGFQREITVNNTFSVQAPGGILKASQVTVQGTGGMTLGARLDLFYDTQQELAAGLLIQQGATFTLGGDTHIIGLATTDPPANITNHGDMIKNAVEDATIEAPFDLGVTGLLDVQGGSLVIREPFTVDGTVDIETFGTLDLAPGSTTIVNPTGSITGPGTLSVRDELTVEGTVDIDGATTMGSGLINGVSLFETNDLSTVQSTLTGNINVTGDFQCVSTTIEFATVQLFGTGLLQPSTIVDASTLRVMNGGDIGTQHCLVEDNSTIHIQVGGAIRSVSPNSSIFGGQFGNVPTGSQLLNEGTFEHNGATLTMALDVQNDGNFVLTNGTLTHNAAAVFNQSPTGIFFTNGQQFTMGTLNGGIFTGNGGGGTFQLAALWDVQGPGNTIGLWVYPDSRTLTGTPQASYRFEIAGPTRGLEYDAIDGGRYNLDGDLLLQMVNGGETQISNTDELTIVDAAAVTINGAFANVASGGDLETINGNGVFTVHYGTGSPFGTDKVVLTNFRAFCPVDTDADGMVGITDFLAVLSQWGSVCPCTADVSGPGALPDGIVGINDFLAVLANWGMCP